MAEVQKPVNLIPPNNPVNLIPVDFQNLSAPPSAQFLADLLAWEEAMGDYREKLQEIKQLAAHLKTHTTDMAQIIQIMGLMMSPSENKIEAQSKLLDLDTDMRNQINNAQSGFNAIGSNANTDAPNTVGAKAKAGAQEVIKSVQELETMLNLLKANGAIDGDTYNNFESAISSLKQAFDAPAGDNKIKTNIWGNADGMASNIQWMISEAEKNGISTPGLKSIQDSFQTQVQSATALSTTTNTQLQYTTEQLKQLLGSYQSAIQSYLKLTAAQIQAQISR